tara:strand:- start:108 stop:1295 length:1188 start_codon:yes stop_codon:yes gene_type:complete
MKNIKFFDEKLDVENKKIILRTDFNVPIINNEIKEKTRIDLIIPFIQKLLSKKAKIILISHLGRPDNNKDIKFSLKPIYEYLKKKFDNISFFTGLINNNIVKEIDPLKKSEIIMLENMRFNPGEMKNDEAFAKNLSSLGDIYINEAFSCSHRKQASIHKIANFMKNCFAGPQFRKEIESINIILKNKKRPVTCIIGGAKVSTKIGVLKSLLKLVDNIIVVGAMANNFIAYKGYKIGTSLVEKGSKEIIEELYNYSLKNNCKLIIPEDSCVSNDRNGKSTYKNLDQIADDEMILDIGKNTIMKILKLIDNSKTIFWNGPAGYFENKNFSDGTISIAKKISENTEKKILLSIVGGGDTISAIKNNNINLNFTHLSTAGGAFLEFIEGKNLPGVEVLK